MDEEAILRELKSIKYLLAVGKEADIERRYLALSDQERRALTSIDTRDWIPSSVLKEDLEDQLDVSDRRIRQILSGLVQENLLERRGRGRSTEYRKSDLYRLIEVLGIAD